MGPRSHERGNLATNPSGRVARQLQWGRVLMNAETRHRLMPRGVPGRLQWGRVLMNAETRRAVILLRNVARFNGAAFS